MNPEDPFTPGREPLAGIPPTAPGSSRPTATEQAETREIQESSSMVFEHAPIGMALLSPEGRWLKVNQALCDLVGYSEAELLARTPQDITPPGEIEAGREDARRLMAGEARSCEFQKHYVHQRGHLIAVSINLSLVRDGEGQPRYFIALTQDITERERAESASQESQRVARATLDALSSHVAILDEHGVIVEVNAAWNRFADQTCFNEGQCGVGDNYLESCDAADSSKGAAALSGGIRAVMAGQSDEFQLEYPCHAPNEQRWLLVHVTRFCGDGRPIWSPSKPPITCAPSPGISSRRSGWSCGRCMSGACRSTLPWKTAIRSAPPRRLPAG